MITVPRGLIATDGPDNGGYPFNIEPFFLSSLRYLQLFPADEFTGVPIAITGLAFRPDREHGGPFKSVLPNVQISLSTTSRQPDELRARFADNIGADETVVHTGPLLLSGSFSGPHRGPLAFDIVIPFTAPFLYDPRNGNLLLDVRNFSGGSTTQFDAYHDPAFRALRVFSDARLPETEGMSDWIAQTTQFQASPTPEPGTLLLFGSCLAAYGFRGWRRARIAAPHQRNAS
jgi:hypothetical protein